MPIRVAFVFVVLDNIILKKQTCCYAKLSLFEFHLCCWIKF